MKHPPLDWKIRHGYIQDMPAMSNRQINVTLDQHDYDQLKLLAQINKLTISEQVRRMLKAQLDGRHHLPRG